METVKSTRLSCLSKAELRASHAGEAGAVWIYRGILFVNWFRGDEDIRQFAQQHLKTEKQHLAGFEEIIHHFRGSLLLLFWAVAGFITGALPALFGKDYVFYTIYCVESFVDEHYREQIELLRTDAHPVMVSFMKKMKEYHADERHHMQEALQLMTTKPTRLMKWWGMLIGKGSAGAVVLAKRI
jgi:ubiquinone biosynthesis monooxygenase Coq7